MLKFFGLVGLLGTVVTLYLVTYGVGPDRQLPPEVSLLEGFREEGLLPESPNLADDHSAEEGGAFEVPEQDAVVLAAALVSMGDMDMAGMDMNGSDAMAGMDMDGAADAMEGMDMAENGDAVLDMDMDGDGVMDMSSAEMANMQDVTMPDEDHPEEEATDMAEADHPEEDMNMSPSSAARMGEGGILISDAGEFDRVVELTMTEWAYSDMQLDVTRGERVKLVVTNDGQIPHEFMIMTMPLMAAANYRLTRADWSLLEHKALFEKALILPGGSFEIIIEVQEPGSWMYMCMLPYHMQLGMMGQMATAGMAMDMAM
ncbi:MAG: multicopper oxidase domain-containing protein [Rhodobacteraceae bacterium]|nr:multicopper oxidase domain-containing protein [Paracoccaceae bacterium]